MSLMPDSFRAMLGSMDAWSADSRDSKEALSPRRGGGQEPLPAETGPRSVTMFVYPGIQALDAVGPLEVLAAATERLGEQRSASAAGAETIPGRGNRGYASSIFGPRAGATVRASSGLAIGVDRTYEDLPDAIDTLIVAGGNGTAQAIRDARILASLEAAAGRARRICSVCTGAFLLAEVGLLAGRRATTHWNSVDLFAKRYPDVLLEPDAIYVRDGERWTSAGVTAGMDLALALVEEDCGREVALDVSRRMVFFLKRPGGQSQFSAQLAGQLAGRDPLRDLQARIVEHPERAHTVESLAAQAGMSPRNFSRVFADEVGITPARFVERVRVEAARRRLEESRKSIEEVASQVGFGSAETMRRAFLRQLGVGPAAYRERFITA